MGLESALALEDIAALPGVRRAGRVDGVFMSEAHVDSLRELDAGFIVLATDDMAVYEIGGPARIEGRLPDPEAANEVFVSARAAEINDFEVGDVFHGRLLTEADFDRLEQAGAIDDAITLFNRDDFGELVDLDIVGIGTFFDEVVVDEGFNTGSMLVTPAFFQAYDQPSAGFWGAVVDLEPGVDVDDFRADVEALVPDETIAFQTRVAVEDQAERAIRPQVAALTVFTAVAALIGLVIVGQAVSRRLQFDAVAFAPLRALGLTERQRAALSLSRTTAAAVVGGLIAVVIAAAASPIAPVGVARDAEPAPGLRVEWWVVLGGAVIIVAVVVILAVWPALRSVRPAPAGTLPRRGLVLGGGSRAPALAGRGHAVRPRPGAVEHPHPLDVGGGGDGGPARGGHVDLRRQPRPLHRLASALRDAMGRGGDRGEPGRGQGGGHRSARVRRSVRHPRSRATACSRPARSCSMASPSPPWPWPTRPSRSARRSWRAVARRLGARSRWVRRRSRSWGSRWGRP